MPPPTVTCTICNSVITKRKSLLIEPFGRICRTHPQVEEHQNKLKEMMDQANANRKLQDAINNFQAIAVCEQLRMMAYMQNANLETILWAYLWKIPKQIRETVRTMALEKGPLTKQEMDEAIAMAGIMIARGDFSLTV